MAAATLAMAATPARQNLYRRSNVVRGQCLRRPTSGENGMPYCVSMKALMYHSRDVGVPCAFGGARNRTTE